MSKLFKNVKLFWIKKFGEPNHFWFMSDSDTDSDSLFIFNQVGPELKALHLTFHDMAPYACRCKLTEEVILNDLDANAIKIINFERIDDYNGITTFQPYKMSRKQQKVESQYFHKKPL